MLFFYQSLASQKIDLDWVEGMKKIINQNLMSYEARILLLLEVLECQTRFRHQHLYETCQTPLTGCLIKKLFFVGSDTHQTRLGHCEATPQIGLALESHGPFKKISKNLFFFPFLNNFQIGLTQTRSFLNFFLVVCKQIEGEKYSLSSCFGIFLYRDKMAYIVK